MAEWITSITNQHVRELSPYESARRLFSADENNSGQIWLNANEAPMSEDFSVNSALFNRYPDCQPQEVISSYARYAGISSGQVIATRGADEGIELIIRAFCEPGKSSVLICPPTYGMYAISAQTFNVGVHKAPLTDDFSLNLDAMGEYVDKVNVVFLCSPNNPTGTRIEAEQIVAVLNMFKDKALVVLDEAYIEFDADATQSALLSTYNNLVILRTLSKAHALAGIRCGFVLSNTQVCQTLMKVIAPYPVPAPVAQVAAQALNAEGIAVMYARVKTLQQGIDTIVKRLSQIDQLTLCGDTKANFVLFKTPYKNKLMAFLVSKGVIIRDQSKQHNLDNCLRITVGSEQENDILLSLIQGFFQEQAISSTKEPS
ncbi:histidinol-phosphate transaminase [Glaciecola siphonariae]|uniref:Histidinol-phosphate aminotransferase n=1 Tax=Glaciecola siphonariae TaxID=521012 RepID=A0ABV9M0X1_9ALTE